MSIELSPEQIDALPYRYHVAYSHVRGFGRTVFYRSTPITHPDEIREWEQLIAADPAADVEHAVVLSWQRFETA